MLITIDKESKVYININEKKGGGGDRVLNVIKGINSSRNLGLSETEMQNFVRAPIIGVPFNSLKGYLDMSHDDQEKVKQPGIPVLDTLNNELVWWISETEKAFSGEKFLYLVKGDGKSKYPTFEAIINALRKNDKFKYNLVTSQEGAPEGTDLYKERKGIK
jgi:hypothetical protein